MTTSAPVRRPTTSGPAAQPPAVRRTWRAATAVALVAVAFVQAPGRLVADTKLDLVTDPARFLGRSLLAWDPHAAFGQLQNQAYGYLFPMGPFFLLGDLAGLPGWVVQRTWWALLLVVAFAGLLAVADELGVGTPVTRLVAAIAFALSPRVLSTLGALSVESWPYALAPWILLPLVRGAARGDPRRHALTSALLLACVGAVNAAATLAALLPATVWLATRSRGPRRTRLVRWWLGGLALAAAWWVLPLLVLGRYAYPFLDYIESARTTTSVTSVPNVLRGVSDWVAFSPNVGEPAWPAGWSLATHVPLVLATAGVAALGLLGVALRGCPERRFLSWSVATGVLLMAVGHSGPLAGPVRDLLDGPLAAFRNVHKAEPVLRLAVALGLAHLLAVAPAALRSGWARLPATWGLPGADTALRGSAWLVAALLAVAVSPAWTGGLAPQSPYGSVPGYWHDAARWLDAHPDGRTLLVPGSSFGDYTWGHTGDEPLVALARSSVAVRDAVPLGAPGATRLLDGVGAELAAGRPSPGLAGALARAGIGRLLLRNDLDPRASVDPLAVVRATLAGSPGLRRAARFGTPVGGTEGRVADLVGSTPPPAALEVWDVLAPTPAVTVTALDGVRRLGGGPEAATALAAAGLDGTATVDVDQPVPGLGRRPAVVTDSLRRRRLDVGSTPGSGYGPTLPAGATVGAGRAAGDLLDVPVAAQTVARFAGGADVRSSPSAADPTRAGWRGPGAHAAAAFDGDPATAWISAGTGGRRWLEVRWPRARRVGPLRVVPSGLPGIAGPQRVRVTTAGGTATGRADRAGVVVVVPPAGATRRVRLDLLGAPAAAQVGVAEVGGLRVPEVLVLPGQTAVDPARDAVLLTRSPDRTSCVASVADWLCSPRLARPGEDASTWRRELTVSTAGSTAVTATVRARPGRALDRALDAALGFAATGSSVLVDHPAARPGAAVDGDGATAWVTAADDPAPTLTVTYPRPVTIGRFTLSTDAQSRAGLRAVVVAAGRKQRLVPLGGRRLPSFAPLTARTFRFTLVRSADRTSPVRVEELVLPGVARPPARARVRQACGRGPAVDVAGTRVDLAVDASVADLVAGAAVPAVPCGGGRLSLAAGPALVVARASRVVAAQTVGLGAGGPAAGVDHRAARVRRDDAEHRVVAVGAGPAALLVLDEGSNAGWQATAGGHRLRAVTVDRWRQAFLLPAGGATTVDLRFGPGRWHRAGLAVGLLALLALVALRVAVARRPLGAGPAGPALVARGGGGGAVPALVVGVLLGGPVGAGVAVAAAVVARRAGAALALAAALYVVAAVAAASSDRLSGGRAAQWAALAALLLGLAVRRRRHGPAPAVQHRAFDQVP